MSKLRKSLREKTMMFEIRKYYRWCRRYMRRVRMIEREIGGCIEAC